ncbi:glycoside hydrolase [Granulicella sp. 5B5]|nr:glycoside hydrolase [Granulicella sp. 5B5]
MPWQLRMLVGGMVLVPASMWAQDRRVVTEPKIPAVCVKLDAKLMSTPDENGGALRSEDEGKLDTERIQKALDGCGAGKAVELSLRSKDNAFLSGPLEMREGVTLLIDKGVTLFGSSDPAVYEMPNPDAKSDAPIKCGTSTPRPTSFPTFSTNQVARPRGGCRPLISVNVKNAAIMGEGTIDGRGYAKMRGHDISWWQMARAAQPHDDLYYSTRLILASHADGLVLYKIHLNNSPNFHVAVNQTHGFTAWGVHLMTPVNKALIGTGNDARNTDGIDPGTSEDVTIAHSWIDNGDDNIAIKQGVSHMSVIDDHFYDGHGMSIGSETVLGQSYLLVDGLTEDHTTSGIRIKSNVKRGGPVHDLTYKNVCMRNVPIPIAISPYYTNQTVEPFEDPKYTGDKIPDYKAIKLENIYAETPGDVLIAGLDDAHRTEVTLNNVHITGITPQQMHLAYDDIHVMGCPRGNLPLGNVPASVKVMPPGGPVCLLALLDPCKGKFVPMQ